MSLATLRRGAQRLKAQLEQRRAKEPDLLTRIRQDPTAILTAAGMRPDAWQREVLASTRKEILLLCSRQAGKSFTASALALRTALTIPDSLVLLLSPTLRQSGELYRDKLCRLFSALGRPMPLTQESALSMTLANRSRIVSLPGKEGNIRGYSNVKLLVIDEAARVPDLLYRSVRPMLAVSRGRLICLSSAFGKAGFFFEAWESGTSWHKIKITAHQVSRISAEFLEREKEEVGERYYRMDYLCEFTDLISALFTEEQIDRSLQNSLTPLFGD